ncbi:SDR family NAD(P)-dependent oxidoreductase [Arthrobacter sp. W4I7]|uniref:SDR family NAD(P)-dependent oxidoreductase n=1 Tax=Arthrobacter sp. W4I7 TaxID=3042296 RepID=UPI0027D77824|nr:glucose 1-dehydrogenase [Arthrobacter sp. W4I7]
MPGPDLTGRVVLVTGGSRGIGRAIAAAMARHGATVVIASRKLGACEQAAAEIHQETGAPTQARTFHVGRWDECTALAQGVLADHGRCDVLVNNAGMSPLYDDLAGITEEYYDKVMAVNLKGAFRLGALLGRHMATGDGGSIINISTIGSLRAGSDELVYAMAKAGMNALTVGLAEAYAPRVRVNAILPGAVASDIAQSWSPEYVAELESAIPVGRLGRPEDMATAAVWLASDGASFVNGELLRIDGGQYRQTS